MAMGRRMTGLDPASGDRLQIDYWPLERLIPFARNARTHSAAQVAEIAGSIRAFGFSNPILVGAEGDVIAGHGRLAAARQLGLAEVPVVVLANLSELQRRQLVLADNRIALNAGWDMEMLKLELTELSLLGADLSVLGFNERELATALNGAASGLTDEDAIPDIGETAISSPGNIWCLGPHRIACGDSTDAKLVGALLSGALPKLMVTDLGTIPGRDCLRMAWGASRNDCCGEPVQERFFNPGSDHLGQGTSCDEPRRLSLAARTLLVRCSQKGQLDWRSQTDDAVEHPDRWTGRRDQAFNAEAGRMYAPAHAQ